MDLRVSDVARLLGEAEDTIYHWAREGSLPAHRVHEQYRFNRVELQEWATAHGRCLPAQLFAGVGSELPSLRAALDRGGIHYNIAGTLREEVLSEVAKLPGVPTGVDRSLLHQLLVGRERTSSSAIGNGMAIPHTRDPLVVRVPEPVLLLCFLASPVDFHAIDGQPVQVLFTLLSPSVPKHLQVLSRLGALLHDELFRALLLRAAPPEAIVARLEALEAPAPGAP
jgi:nitrogen PTS system EIIA component